MPVISGELKGFGHRFSWLVVILIVINCLCKKKKANKPVFFLSTHLNRDWSKDITTEAKEWQCYSHRRLLNEEPIAQQVGRAQAGCLSLDEGQSLQWSELNHLLNKLTLYVDEDKLYGNVVILFEVGLFFQQGN